MFRRFFRIGFGGCGCALEEHFRNHAVELARELLLECYVEKLKKWKNVLSLDKFEMENVGGLEGNLKESMFNDETFNDKLEEIKKELASWNGSLGIAKERTGMSYEEDIVEELSSIITEMGTEVEEIKTRGRMLLESLPVDSYTGPEKKRIYAYNQDITETRDLIVDQYGHAIIESQGFNHQPELQMLPFSIHEVRNEVYSNIKNKISKDNLLQEASGGYLFFVGLGGGTGTGVISPLAERFGKGSFGYFTLGVLGGVGDNEKLGSQQPWFRRCFNMLLALNDLLVTAELDGIILLDNDVIIPAIEKEKKFRQSDRLPLMERIDRKIIEELYPAFGITALENKENELDWAQLKGPIGLKELKRKPPVFVPCYASGDGNLEDLIDVALKEDNRWANCECEDNGESIVEKVFVYTRCIEDEEAVRQKLAKIFGTGDKDIAFIKEYLFCWDEASKKDEKKVKSFLKDYGIEWADKAEIRIQHPNSDNAKPEMETLEIKNTDSGEQIGLQITNKVDVKIPETLEYILPKLKIKKENGKRHVYLKGCKNVAKKWILEELKDKKVVVFESQEIGTYWKVRALIEKSKVEGKACEVNHEIIRNFKNNEVLILLVNPNIKNALYDRLQEANKFVGLLDKLKELIDERGAGSQDKSGIADDIINNIVNGSIQDTEIDKILNDISTVGIDKTIKEPKKKILAEAKAFLFPEELIEKNVDIYEHMKGILKRLTSEAENACNNLEKGTWPIFREKIFNITSISGKRDEVILSSISAMDKKTEDEFKRLVGDAYGTYSKSFQRQFFKYNTHYLYPGCGADYILRDEAEEKLLPVELKNEIEKVNNPLTGRDLEKLVKEHMDNEVLTVYDPAKISFPTMLALAGLYSKWQYLFSWDREKKEGSKLSYNNKSIGEDEVKEKLFENRESVQSADFEICLLSETKKNEKKYKLLINDEKKETDDEKEEDATLTIRAGRSLFEWEGEITGNKIPQGLKDKFKAMLNIVLTEDMIPEQEQGRWKVEHGNSNYYIQQKKLEEECKIYGDELHKLKVKNEEESGKFKFKIYKRRGEMF